MELLQKHFNILKPGDTVAKTTVKVFLGKPTSPELGSFPVALLS